MGGWTARRFGVALLILAVWLVSTYVEDLAHAPSWVRWLTTAIILGSWLIVGNLKRFR